MNIFDVGMIEESFLNAFLLGSEEVREDILKRFSPSSTLKIIEHLDFYLGGCFDRERIWIF